MSLQLSIPDTSVVSDSGTKPYTVYHIHIRLPLRALTVQKRYTEFLALHADLTTHTGQAPPQQPPPKTILGSTVNNPTRTESRRRALESYLLAILNASDSRWRECPAWRSFLSLPPSWSANSSTATLVSPSATSSNAPVTSPSIWLDSHRDLKQLLHDARLALAKREQATAPTELHESSAASKRCLVKASALITGLDAGLREMSKEGNLLEGEVRRRRDLLAAARRERDGLESLASTMSVKRQTAGPAVSSASSDAGKVALLGSRAPGGGQGRVLGAPLPETERTRELDNQGVLNLQQQIFQEQDSGVQRLLRIVGRQKEMGVMIGDEIETQNRMLDQLSQDIERVDAKTRAARKKADRIS